MNAAQGTDARVAGRRPFWLRLLAGLVLCIAALVLLVVLFPWDLLRGPLNRYVSEKTGRHFEITRRLDVKVGRTTRIVADGIEFANPPWAVDPFLLRAEGAEVEVRLLPLLRGRVDLPLIELRKPQLGLQIESDGRRTWALGREDSSGATAPNIGALVVDEGAAHYVAAHQGADIRVGFSLDRVTPVGSGSRPADSPAGQQEPGQAAASSLPLRFEARGTWRKEPFTAAGRTGNVLVLGAPLQKPFPAEVTATAGGTRLEASGTVATLSSLEGADVTFNLQGQNLEELYRFIGVVLPATPRYALQGRLSNRQSVWQVRQIEGRLGNSDLQGQLSYDRSRPVGFLQGQLSSRTLDFDDLAPLVGLPEQPRSARGAASKRAVAAPRSSQRKQPPKPPAGKVLPVAKLDAARLKGMNADVRYSAKRVTNARPLPFERISVHVQLKDGALQLEPLDLGVAGGRLAGRLRVDGSVAPAVAEVKLDARALELGKLFPVAQSARATLGRVHGDIDLKGRGDSVAQMLGSASGNFALLMGKGQISNILLEFAGLDGAEIVKFLMQGDQSVRVRCAATAFDVQRGVMTTRAFVLDTTDTVIYGNGTISLADETLNLKLHPYPKDPSILSMRSPLVLSGTFESPAGSVDMGALAGRAGLAIALGAINPLLALAATIETGPGEDADCGAALREAAAPRAAARANAAPPPPAPPERRRFGGPARSRPGAHYPLESDR